MKAPPTASATRGYLGGVYEDVFADLYRPSTAASSSSLAASTPRLPSRPASAAPVLVASSRPSSSAGDQADSHVDIFHAETSAVAADSVDAVEASWDTGEDDEDAEIAALQASLEAEEARLDEAVRSLRARQSEAERNEREETELACSRRAVAAVGEDCSPAASRCGVGDSRLAASEVGRFQPSMHADLLPRRPLPVCEPLGLGRPPRPKFGSSGPLHESLRARGELSEHHPPWPSGPPTAGLFGCPVSAKQQRLALLAGGGRLPRLQASSLPRLESLLGAGAGAGVGAGPRSASLPRSPASASPLRGGSCVA